MKAPIILFTDCCNLLKQFEHIHSNNYNLARANDKYTLQMLYVNKKQSKGCSRDAFIESVIISYYRHLSYCFYIALNRICVAISRVEGTLKPWSAIHLGVGNSKQNPAYMNLPVPAI